MNASLVLLPGDGIGPEIVAAAQTVLEVVTSRFNHSFDLQAYPMGGVAIDLHGEPLPEATLAACRKADAILLGAVGGPKWDRLEGRLRPESGLLGLRKGLDLFANLRPVQPHPDLIAASPLKPERLVGVDLLVVRELTGGLYFGQPRLRRVTNGEEEAVDTMQYSQSEIRRVVRMAFRLAAQRRSKVTSVDKANVLECSRLWRQTAEEIAGEFPGIAYENLLVDAAAMHLLTRPADFDVIVTENLFGDILTDEASVLAGSIGTLPSASLGTGTNQHGLPRGLYEPIHGSAPDIAGKGIANPVGTILSLALLLRYSLGLETEAGAVEAAVRQTLSDGCRTSDLVLPNQPALSTEGMTAAITERLIDY
jgi:3-isopropylmalate dehydrogenase